jgi:hypothetical protein
MDESSGQRVGASLPHYHDRRIGGQLADPGEAHSARLSFYQP